VMCERNNNQLPAPPPGWTVTSPEGLDLPILAMLDDVDDAAVTPRSVNTEPIPPRTRDRSVYKAVF
jgi:hypothetical protein